MVERIDQKRVSSRGSGSDAASSANNNQSAAADDGSKVKLQSMKLTQFFSKKGSESSKPLAPAKQRAIPIIK